MEHGTLGFYMCVYLYVYIQIYTSVFGGQMPTLVVFLNYITDYFLRQVLALSLNLTNLVRLVDQHDQSPSVLNFLGLEL